MYKKLKVLLLFLSLQTLQVLPMAYVRNAGRIAKRPIAALLRHCGAHKKLYGCAAVVGAAGAYAIRRTMQRQPQAPIDANQTWWQRLRTRVVGWVRPVRQPQSERIQPEVIDGAHVFRFPVGVHKNWVLFNNEVYTW